MLTADHPGRYRFAHFGRGAVIAFPPGTVFGESAISIGDGTLIGEWVTLTAGLVPGQDLLGFTVLRIGKGSSIGRGSMVIAHESVEIGDDVFIAPNCYVTDQNHSYADLDVPVGRQMPDNSPVVIGDGCWIGTRAVILPGARLGRNVTVAAGSVVRGEFPDYCVIGGTPARILRRHDPEHGWVAVPSTDRRTSTEDGRTTEANRATSTEDGQPTAARTG
jgi:acetyltransferase-like isoleucine patch superfamily enzyme